MFQVLETLFSFLPLSTLIECRLVCQLWNDLCTPHAAKQCQPTIMNLDLASNLKDLTSPGSGFPYSKVVIHSVSIGNSKLNQHEQLAMIQTMAPFVTQIHLESFNKGYFPFNNYLPEDIRFSKLKSVHIQFTTLSDTQALAHNTQLLTRIMNRAPLLNQLTLTNLNQTVNITDLRKSLKECEQFCKIKKLSLSGPLQTSHLNVLTEMGQSLKELHMEFRHGSEVDTQVITDYLESHHLTLEQLTVEVHASGEMVKVELPRLEKLKGLKVFAGHFNSFRTQGESICYRNQLPALKSLELLAESCEYGFYEYDINFPATTLTSLVFPTTIESLSLGTAATMFPNLKSIQLPMRVEHIESLCLFKWKCSGMEELRLKTPSQHLGQCFAENVLQTDFTDDLNSTTLISSTTKKAAYFLQGILDGKNVVYCMRETCFNGGLVFV